MAGGIVKNGCADLVRAKDNFYCLGPPCDTMCNPFKVSYKFLGVSLARERQHAKQVVRAKTDGHTPRILLTALARIEAPAIHRHSFHSVNRDDLGCRVVRAVDADRIFHQILSNFLGGLVLDRNAD